MLYDGIKIPEATLIQKELRNKLDIRERNLDIKTIAGADISLNLYSSTIYAGIIILHFPSLIPLSFSLIKAETHFPYIPGYLAFREIPALEKAWNQLPLKPDILMVDGHGIAHPRRMGIAAHFGALTQQPTLGCAKKILFGKYEDPLLEKGSYSPIMDKSEQIGFAFRSKYNVKPVFVSPGNLIGMENSLEIIKNCGGKYRLPEPTRLAHNIVNNFRKGEITEGYHQI